MAKMRGLGRGLDALLGGNEETPPAEALREVELNALSPGRYQPRSHMDPQALSELADSIRSQGLIQPIVVRPLEAGRYEILAGERRWRAAQMAGLQRVPVVIRDVPDRSALAFALIENIQREDLNPLEQATGLKRLIDEFGLTHEQAAQAIGASRSHASNLLRLLALAPHVQDLVRTRKLDMGHARALLALEGARQVEIANRVLAAGMSVRQTEQLVRAALRAPGVRAHKRRDHDLTLLERELADRLGTTVQIRPGRRGTGRVVVRYASLDHLDALLAKLRA
jgi:ParB family chromosome partitioning protein